MAEYTPIVKFFRILGFAVIGFICLAVVTSLFSTSDNEGIKEASVIKKDSVPSAPILSNSELISRQIKEIKAFNPNAFKSSLDSLQAEILMIAMWGSFTLDTLYNKEERESIKKELVKFQAREFPLLRKAYAKLLKEKLWEHDIEVDLLGKGNSQLTLTGGLYASNKNIKESQELIQDMVIALRFKQINYKWYEYDEEYTYYELPSKKDNEIK